MDTLLWTKVSEFDLDKPLAEYGFSIRLAKENYWTKDFTEKAILEYKKFMYLAGTSDLMVSPSKVVDEVWHLHLTFTQSYTEFCKIVGKQIQHVPSTHTKEEEDKFRNAKERTKKLYNEVFGDEPEEIWNYPGMYDSLKLEKAKFKLRTFVIFGMIASCVLIVPFYYFLGPIYVHIDNPFFLQGYISIIALTVLSLEIYNRQCLEKIMEDFNESAFAKHLHPSELTYLRTSDLSNVIHFNVNRLIENQLVDIDKEKRLILKGKIPDSNVEEYTIAGVMNHFGKIRYSSLLKMLVKKPVFSNVANAMNAFKKYFVKSKSFGRIFYLNFAVMALLMMLGSVRLITGVLRDKPVALLVTALIFLAVITAIYLERLTKLMFTNVIPRFYRKVLLPSRGDADASDWNYSFSGQSALSPLFIPIIDYGGNYASAGSSGSCGSGGCGSSCGGGSGCGGCGGS